jgi:hypothetical protein
MRELALILLALAIIILIAPSRHGEWECTGYTTMGRCNAWRCTTTDCGDRP